MHAGHRPNHHEEIDQYSKENPTWYNFITIIYYPALVDC
jgi:hypothetical protein